MDGAVGTCHQLRPGPASEQEGRRTSSSAVAAGHMENPNSESIVLSLWM